MSSKESAGWFRVGGIPTKAFETLRETIGSLLCVDDAILDGEIVCLDASGHSLFKDLLYRRDEPVLYAFDVLWLNGRDLRNLTLSKFCTRASK